VCNVYGCAMCMDVQCACVCNVYGCAMCMGVHSLYIISNVCNYFMFL